MYLTTADLLSGVCVCVCVCVRVCVGARARVCCVCVMEGLLGLLSHATIPHSQK